MKVLLISYVLLVLTQTCVYCTMEISFNVTMLVAIFWLFISGFTLRTTSRTKLLLTLVKVQNKIDFGCDT
jgi:hypothetical protein